MNKKTMQDFKDFNREYFFIAPTINKYYSNKNPNSLLLENSEKDLVANFYNCRKIIPKIKKGNFCRFKYSGFAAKPNIFILPTIIFIICAAVNIMLSKTGNAWFYSFLLSSILWYGIYFNQKLEALNKDYAFSIVLDSEYWRYSLFSKFRDIEESILKGTLYYCDEKLSLFVDETDIIKRTIFFQSIKTKLEFLEEFNFSSLKLREKEKELLEEYEKIIRNIKRKKD